MSFADDLNRFAGKLRQRANDVFVGSAIAVQDSIKFGSPLTAAPGQPVDTGALLASWNLSFESPTSALISTNIEYAETIETNVRGAQFNNHGPHSVALTVAGFGRLVAAEVAKVAS